jgi:hypothetical protein
MAGSNVRIDISAEFKPGMRSCGNKLLHKVAHAVVTDAKRIVPIDTGLLRSRIGYRIVSPSTARISAKTHYAVYVERGTHNDDGSVRMVAQPYLRPALYQVRVGKGGVR